MSEKATPRPWVRGKGAGAGYILAVGDGTQPVRHVAELYYAGLTAEERNANADLIVTAVNAHDSLAEACRLALIEMDRITGDIGFEPERASERLAVVNALVSALIRSGG